MMKYGVFLARLRNVLQARGISQKEVADVLNRNLPTANRILNGRTSFRMADFFLLLDAFQISPAEIMEDVHAGHAVAPDLQDLCNRVAALPLDNQVLVRNQLLILLEHFEKEKIVEAHTSPGVKGKAGGVTSNSI